MAWFDDLSLPGTEVEGYFGFVTADGRDENQNPDVILASGTVTFTPTAAATRVGDVWLGIQSVTAQIFEGRIMVSEEDPSPVRILSTDAETAVLDWAWKATFDIGGFKLNPLTFKAPADTTVNLTAGIMPITSAPYQLVQGEPGESAYEVAVRGGYVGTEADWLASLHGESGASTWDAITGKPATYPASTHTHDDRYYTEAEVDAKVAANVARLTVLERDTGTRRIEAAVPGLISGEVTLRRVGKVVMFSVNELAATPNNGASTLTLPSAFIPPGFRFFPPTYAYYASFARSAAHNIGSMRINRYGGIDMYDMNGLKSNVVATWITDEAYPTILPGIPG